MPSNGSPTPQEPQPSRGQQRISPSTKPHQLKNGLWNCPRCSATFAHKVIAVYHLNHEHDTRRALDFKEVIEVQPLPRQPHKVETIVKVEESKSEIKTSTTKRKVTAEILGPGGLITLREVDGKWPCPTGCGAIFGTVSSVSRHTNSTACYRVLQKVEQPKKPVRTTREPGRLPVSTRMQCRQLGISMESDITDPLGDISLQSKSISRAVTCQFVEAYRGVTLGFSNYRFDSTGFLSVAQTKRKETRFRPPSPCISVSRRIEYEPARGL